jgi:hypothetical protein
MVGEGFRSRRFAQARLPEVREGIGHQEVKEAKKEMKRHSHSVILRGSPESVAAMVGYMKNSGKEPVKNAKKRKLEEK